jgi:DNA-binding HxlR family transcriptional regulator
MKQGYGQFCPLALAAELLCERWTLLIVHRLIEGCTQFNAIQRSLPRITPAMLSKRLRELDAAGLVVSAPAARGHARTYQLTDAGRALAPTIFGLATWGQAWARDMRNDDLDPTFVAWSLHTQLDPDRLPAQRVVIEFEFSGVAPEGWRCWLVSEGDAIDMCLDDPGFEVDLQVRSDLRLFIEAWRGIRDLRAEIRARHIELAGAPGYTREFAGWFKPSALAPHARQAAGRERELARAARRH